MLSFGSDGVFTCSSRPIHGCAQLFWLLGGYCILIGMDWLSFLAIKEVYALMVSIPWWMEGSRLWGVAAMFNSRWRDWCIIRAAVRLFACAADRSTLHDIASPCAGWRTIWCCAACREPTEVCQIRFGCIRSSMKDRDILAFCLDLIVFAGVSVYAALLYTFRC